jgi:hypothetical protein
MGRKLLLIVLGATAAALVVSARRRARTVDATGNGGTAAGDPRLRRLVGEARRPRVDTAG